MPTDADRDELELRVSDVAYEVADFAWADLAERVPIGTTYTRPQNEGPYMSVTWDADWKEGVGGPILIKIQGFLDPKHEVPTWGTGEIIRKRSFLDTLLRRPHRTSIKPPNSIGTGDCSQCGHVIGYHHAGTEEQMPCTVDGCECSGYDEGAMPRSWRPEGRYGRESS